MTCEILREYCRSRDLGDAEDAARLENEAMKAHIGLAKVRASRGRWGDLDDHVQAASLGLLEAVRGFDPTRGSTLSSYAWPKMATELARESARQAPAGVRVPRARWQAGERSLVVGDSADEASDHGDDDVERFGALDRAASCWRASSLGEDPAETLTRAAAALVALGGSAWPGDLDGRLAALARLDAAVEMLSSEHPIDGELWRRHHLGGELWGSLAAEMGVTRQRVSARARRRQARLVEILASLEHVEDAALEVWASPTPAVKALRRVGLLSPSAGPVETAYMAEDLEVALTEIDERAARAWSQHYLEQRPTVEVARAVGCRRQDEAQRLIDRGSVELARLLRSDVEPEQLELVAVECVESADAVSTASTPSTPLAICWWSPIIVERQDLRAVERDDAVFDLRIGRSSARGRGSAKRARPEVYATDRRGVGPPPEQLQLV